MKGLFILAAISALMALAPARAQTGNPAALTAAPGSIAGPSGVPASSGNEIDPALSLRGMPCSVSLNATGGVTTSSSCGSDPLEVPTRTLASPDQASNVANTAAAAAQTSTGGSATSGQGTTGATTQGGNANKATSATSSGSAGGGALSSTSTLCSSTISTTTGSSSPGSLFGAGC